MTATNATRMTMNPPSASLRPVGGVTSAAQPLVALKRDNVTLNADAADKLAQFFSARGDFHRADDYRDRARGLRALATDAE